MVNGISENLLNFIRQDDAAHTFESRLKMKSRAENLMANEISKRKSSKNNK